MCHYLAIFFILACAPLKATFFEFLAIETEFSYRQDCLSWNIGSPTGSPNILSEVIWKDVGTWQFSTQAKAFLFRDVYTRFQLDYGWIVRGINHDLDFLGDDRTQLFSHSINQSNQGCVYDISGAFSYLFKWQSKQFSLFPLIGYSEHSQYLVMKDGKRVFNLFSSHKEGPIYHLHSTYHTKWYGPWLGIDIAFYPNRHFSLSAAYECHCVYYQAKAYWNLRLDMPDGFRHEANGYGHVMRLGLHYHVNEQWLAAVFLHYQIWWTRRGIDITKLSDENESSFKLYQPLNQVNWRSLAIGINIGCQF